LNIFLPNAFIGIYAVFCIIFFIQFFTYHRKEYFFYGLYLALLVIYYILFDTNYIITESQISIGVSTTLKETIAGFAIGFYTLFSIHLLDAKKYSKKLYSLLVAITILNFCSLPLYITLYGLNIPHQQLYYLLNLLFSPVVFYALYQSFTLKIPFTKYIIIGSIISTIGGLCSIVMSIYKVENTYIPGQIAILIDLVLFFYATQKKVMYVEAENIKLRFKTLSDLQEERQRISLELHDEVGGGLSTIHLLSELSKKGNGDPKYMQGISSNSKNLVQKMNEIVWTLNVKNDSLPGTIAYIRQYVVHTLDELEIQVKANVAKDIPNINIEGKSRRELFLIIKEIVNNIVKHSKANEVQLYIEVVQNELEIEIMDNGIGINHTEMLFTSFGMIGLHHRIEQLKGTINWENKGGTKVSVKIPLQSLSYKSAI
jgi:signal transduction histidine kinase